MSLPSGTSNFAKLPGKSSEKIKPKSLQFDGISEESQICNAGPYSFTDFHVFINASRLYRSSSSIVPTSLPLSLSTVDMFFLRFCSHFSTLNPRD